MSIIKEKWDYHNGYAIDLFTLENETGMKVKLTNYGAAVVGIEVPDINGNPVDVVLGYDSFKGYLGGSSYQGAIAGRFANRIEAAGFELDGVVYALEENEGKNTLHGGSLGFDKRVWASKTDVKKNTVIFTYYSHDGEGGFPGNVKIVVKYTLLQNNDLKIKYYAESDKNTVINLTNHAYFNLNGKGDVLDTIMQINAVNYTPVDEYSIPTGEIASVFGTPFNFKNPKRIGEAIENGEIGGFDHNFLLGEFGQMKKAAVAYSTQSGIIMAAFTDMPAIQFYTGNGLGEIGKNGKIVGKYGGFCLETQFTPNSPNLSGFPSCVLKKGKLFKSSTVYAFRTK